VEPRQPWDKIFLPMDSSFRRRLGHQEGYRRVGRLMERAAVILAGGRSERFQRRGESWVDKALTVVNGRTILEGIVVQLRDCVDEIAISVSREQSRRTYLRALPASIVGEVRIFVDEVPSGGPLAGIATSVKHLDARQLLVLPCDTPFLNPAVVRTLFQRMRGNDAAIPIWPNGALEPLMAVYKGSRVRSCCPMLSSAGRRRPDDLIRGSSRVTLVSIKSDLNVFDPEHRSFVNVNYREDVNRSLRPPFPKGSLNRTFTASISLIRDRDLQTVSNTIQGMRHFQDTWGSMVRPLMGYLQERRGFFWLAFLAEETAKSTRVRGRSQRRDQKQLFEAAAQAYQSEARLHLNNDLLSLSAHTLLDAAWCWGKARDEDRSKSALRAAASIYARLRLDPKKSRALATQRSKGTPRSTSVG